MMWTHGMLLINSWKLINLSMCLRPSAVLCFGVVAIQQIALILMAVVVSTWPHVLVGRM